MKAISRTVCLKRKSESNTSEATATLQNMRLNLQQMKLQEEKQYCLEDWILGSGMKYTTEWQKASETLDSAGSKLCTFNNVKDNTFWLQNRRWKTLQRVLFHLKARGDGEGSSFQMTEAPLVALCLEQGWQKAQLQAELANWIYANLITAQIK